MPPTTHTRDSSQRRLAAMTAALFLICATPAMLIGEDQQADALTQYRVAQLQSLVLAQHGAMGAASIVAESVVRQSERHALDPVLVLAVIQVESRFDPAAVSPRGAQGLMQVKKIVVDELVDEGKLPAGRRDLKDPKVNVEVGVSYLAHLVEMFGDLHTALAAYNWGPTRIREKIAADQRIPSDYVSKVLRAQRFLEFELARVDADGAIVQAAG